MKITFKRDTDCDYFDRKLNEEYPKFFRRWDVVLAEAVENDGNKVNIALSSGDSIMGVPRNSVEVAK
jgi:hypothetical protein